MPNGPEKGAPLVFALSKEKKSVRLISVTRPTPSAYLTSIL